MTVLWKKIFIGNSTELLKWCFAYLIWIMIFFYYTFIECLRNFEDCEKINSLNKKSGFFFFLLTIKYEKSSYCFDNFEAQTRAHRQFNIFFFFFQSIKSRSIFNEQRSKVSDFSRENYFISQQRRFESLKESRGIKTRTKGWRVRVVRTCGANGFRKKSSPG